MQIEDIVSDVGGRYESPREYPVRTDADGRFRSDRLPVGRASDLAPEIRLLPPGIGQADRVADEGPRAHDDQGGSAFTSRSTSPGPIVPREYLVHLEPEGGEAVGKWSGSGQIDAKNQIEFDDVPPGRYVLQGRPNPCRVDQQTPADPDHPECRPDDRGHATGQVKSGGESSSDSGTRNTCVAHTRGSMRIHPPVSPLRKGGGLRRSDPSLPPLRRGDTGGFFGRGLRPCATQLISALPSTTEPRS